MTCTIDKKTIDKTIKFHGHTCPGLAIGIRVSELAMERLDITECTSPVCVAETDMCALDAVQYLTGCTYGKGNLVHRDYGKAAFTFFDRTDQKGFRAVLNKRPVVKDGATREDAIQMIMGADLDELFKVEEINQSPVKPARVLESIQCDACAEMVMESRIRRFAGKNLCIPCFTEQEQKI
jgi:formylmethanofuran dehydrogenase subunit E